MTTFTILAGCLKLLLLLAACYVAGAALFGTRGEAKGAGISIAWFIAGLCLISFFFLLSKYARLDWIFYGLLPVTVVALLVLRRPVLRARLDGSAAELGGALALSLLSSLPVLIMGARMGAGDFPAVFFSADSPFFLQQVHALIRTDVYPPPSLEFYGFSFNYHYGIQAFVALASLLTGLKPHFLLFAVVEPLLEVLTGLLVYDLCRRLTGRHSAALACLLLFLVGSKQYLVDYFGPGGWDFIARDENFNFRFPNPPNVAGLLVALCAVRCLVDFESRAMRMAALFFMCMLLIFKIPYLIPIAAGLGLVYLYELRQQFKAGLLLEIGGAALLSALVYVVFATSFATTRAAASFKVLGFLEMSLPWHNETLLIFAVLTGAVAVASRVALPVGQRRLLIVALSPYLLFSLCLFEVGNEYQIFELATRLVALFAAVYLASAWFREGTRPPLARAFAWLVALGLTVPGTLSLFYHAYIVAVRPESGHEYADNRPLAEALLRVPVENTLLVTNDLRYPANNYSRDHRQFQLAGLFGHRNLASNLVYGGLRRDEVLLYVGITQLFQREVWPEAEVGYVKEKFPVTHLLIHKSYGHAKKIPRELIYENAEYAVYRL